MDKKDFAKLVAAGAAGMWLGKKYQEVKLTKEFWSLMDGDTDGNKIIVRGFNKPDENLNKEWMLLAAEKIKEIDVVDSKIARILQMDISPVTRQNRLNKFIIDHSKEKIINIIGNLTEKYKNLYDSEESYSSLLKALDCYPNVHELL